MKKHNAKELSKIEWHFWHVRKRPPLLIYLLFHGAAITAVKEFPEYIKTSGEVVDHVVTKKVELEEFRKQAWKKFKESPEFVLHFMNQMYKQNQNHILLWQKIAKKDFSQMPQKELLQEYKQYVQQLMTYSPATYLPLALEPILSEECYNLLKQKVPVKAQEWYDVVMTPVKESAVIEERKSLLRIALKKNKVEIQKDIQKHIEQFSFLKQKDMFMEFFDEQYYQIKVHSCTSPEKELAELEAEAEKKRKNFQEVLNVFSDNHFAQILFKTTNEAIFFRSWRTERFSQSSYYVISLFKEIAYNLNFEDYKDILYIIPLEIIDIVKNNKTVNKEIIKQRKIAFTYITFGLEESLVLEGKEAAESLTYLKIFAISNESISGLPAFRGKVNGKVLVVTQRDQWLQIQHAEILVIHTTTPDIVPYLKNIKGIITEEGGILSHASVISREMKIPCIIGTKTATKILKTGDYVEVDAEKGIIRRISK